MSDTPFTWVNGPPVIKNPNNPQAVCTEFMDEARRSERPASETARLSWWRQLLFWGAVADEEWERLVWKDRKGRSLSDADYIRAKVADDRIGDRRTFCVYNPGKVTGLLYWYWHEFRDEGVATLVMLPGHESEGTILIELAVNLSEEAGCEGRTYFEQFDSDEWRYDPPWLQCLKSATVVPRDERDAWMVVGGGWRLTKNFRGLRTKSARNIHSPNSV